MAWGCKAENRPCGWAVNDSFEWWCETCCCSGLLPQRDTAHTTEGDG